MCDVNIVPAKSQFAFPEEKHFKPLIECGKLNIISKKNINQWFAERHANKGLEKGRLLAIKLFVKYTKCCESMGMFFITAVCSAEQKKHTDYSIKMLCKAQAIQQATCTCPAGTGFSAACKHVSAVCFSLEHYTLTGNVIK